MPCWKILTLVGLSLNLAGVILLFLYVLPRRQRTGGILASFAYTGVNQKELGLERRWDFYSALGLWAVIIGIVLQALAVWIAP